LGSIEDPSELEEGSARLLARDKHVSPLFSGKGKVDGGSGRANDSQLSRPRTRFEGLMVMETTKPVFAIQAFLKNVQKYPGQHPYISRVIHFTEPFNTHPSPVH